MKCLIILAVVVAVASAQFGGFNRRQPFRAQPQAAASNVYARAAPRASASDQAANIVRYENEISPNGAYSYSYETDNGIAAQEQGTPKQFPGNPPVAPDVAQGSYSYTSPEGRQVVISYVADENGFQPQGDAIPTAPPVPPQIARALEWLARNAPPQRK